MTETRQSYTSLIMFVSLLVVFLVVSFQMIAPYLLSLFMGGILALLAQPVYRYLKNKNMKPRRASALVTLAVILLVVGPVSVFSILAVKQGVVLGQQLSEEEDLSLQSLTGRVSRWAPARAIMGNADNVRRQLRVG